MSHLTRAFAPMLFLAATLAQPAAAADRITDPLRFFEGRTESTSTVKVMMKAPYRTHTVGRGEIADDGSLRLVQRVEEDGRPARSRHWHMRKLAPGRFTRTMSDAKGPVTVDEVDGRYRFRFKMKGGVSVEQWLTPQPGGKSARNTLVIRKFGVKVGSSDGTIRKIP
jgi:hypothetical protein